MILQFLLNGINKGVNVAGADRKFFAGLFEPGHHFAPLPGLATTIFFD